MENRAHIKEYWYYLFLKLKYKEVGSGRKGKLKIGTPGEKHELLPNTEEILILLIGHYSNFENKKRQHPPLNSINLIFRAQLYQSETQNLIAGTPETPRSTFIWCSLTFSLEALLLKQAKKNKSFTISAKSQFNLRISLRSYTVNFDISTLDKKKEH